jgi:hypothetical protein
MADPLPVERREIIEERGNRDAFRLAVMIIMMVIAGLTVLGIAAWNSRFMLMPLVPRAEPKPAVQKAFFVRGYSGVVTIPAGRFPYCFPVRRVQS